jgi:hypothetical protein
MKQRLHVFSPSAIARAGKILHLCGTAFKKVYVSMLWCSTIKQIVLYRSNSTRIFIFI